MRNQDISEFVQDSAGQPAGDGAINEFVTSVLRVMPDYQRYIPVHQRFLVAACRSLGLKGYGDRLEKKYTHNSAFLKRLLQRKIIEIEPKLDSAAHKMDAEDMIIKAEREMARMDGEMKWQRAKLEDYDYCKELLEGQYNELKNKLQEAGSQGPAEPRTSVEGTAHSSEEGNFELELDRVKRELEVYIKHHISMIEGLKNDIAILKSEDLQEKEMYNAASEQLAHSEEDFRQLSQMYKEACLDSVSLMREFGFTKEAVAIGETAVQFYKGEALRYAALATRIVAELEDNERQYMHLNLDIELLKGDRENEETSDENRRVNLVYLKELRENLENILRRYDKKAETPPEPDEPKGGEYDA